MAKNKKRPDNSDSLPKKDLPEKIIKKIEGKGEVEVMAEYSTIAEVAGMHIGTKCKVLEKKNGGMDYLVEILTGPKHGQKFRILAQDLS